MRPHVFSSDKTLYALTRSLPTVYLVCNPDFQYSFDANPRRVLTKPAEGVKNDGFDNAESDYILYVNDIIGDKEGRRLARAVRVSLG